MLISADRREARIKMCKRICSPVMSCCALLVCFEGFVEFSVQDTDFVFAAPVGVVYCMLSVGADIAALYFGHSHDCDSAMAALMQPSTWLVVAGWAHISFVLLMPAVWACLVDLPYELQQISINALGCTFSIFAMALLSWSVVGCLLFAEMDVSSTQGKQCADIVIACSVLRLIECALCIPPIFAGCAMVVMWH